MHDFSLTVMSCVKLLQRYMRHPRQNERWRLFLLIDVDNSEITLLCPEGHNVDGTSGVEEKVEEQASLCPIAVCISCDSRGMSMQKKEPSNYDRLIA